MRVFFFAVARSTVTPTSHFGEFEFYILFISVEVELCHQAFASRWSPSVAWIKKSVALFTRYNFSFLVYDKVQITPLQPIDISLGQVTLSVLYEAILYCLGFLKQV